MFMIGLLIAAHGSLGESLIQCATYVLGQRPDGLQSLNLSEYANAEAMLHAAREHIESLDQGSGVLVLADIYGATPCNTVCKLLRPGRVEAVAGVNLPMLLKALTYRHEALNLLAERAAVGGQAGAFHIRFDHCEI
jgi:PTS system ascorbate-specific IIA component